MHCPFQDSQYTLLHCTVLHYLHWTCRRSRRVTRAETHLRSAFSSTLNTGEVPIPTTFNAHALGYGGSRGCEGHSRRRSRSVMRRFMQSDIQTRRGHVVCSFVLDGPILVVHPVPVVLSHLSHLSHLPSLGYTCLRLPTGIRGPVTLTCDSHRATSHTTRDEDRMR